MISTGRVPTPARDRPEASQIPEERPGATGTKGWRGHKLGGFAMNEGEKNLREVSTPSPLPVASMVESVVGCKWSLHVLACVRRGVNRPGAIERSIEGLSAKVLSERLDKMVRFGILTKAQYPEVPPRVEYALTPFGERFAEILDGVEQLEREVCRDGGPGGGREERRDPSC
jgi:DNA-binding HxlR family transcriptional regulator